jgi:hypothetical protein
MWGPLPDWIFQSTAVLLALAAAGFVFMVLRKFVLEHSLMPLPAVLMIVTGVSIFCFGRDVAGILWLYVPAFFHGAQYLVITTAQQLKREVSNAVDVATDPPKPTGSHLVQMLVAPEGLKYFAVLLVAAISLYIGVPRLLQEMGFEYSRTFAAVFIAINLHHFVTDMAIWKLRDPKLRREIVS